jgi:hypothetical protein
VLWRGPRPRASEPTRSTSRTEEEHQISCGSVLLLIIRPGSAGWPSMRTRTRSPTGSSATAWTRGRNRVGDHHPATRLPVALSWSAASCTQTEDALVRPPTPSPAVCRAGRYLNRVVQYSGQLWPHGQKMSLQEAVKRLSAPFAVVALRVSPATPAPLCQPGLRHLPPDN